MHKMIIIIKQYFGLGWITCNSSSRPSDAIIVVHIEGLAQDCSNSSALAMELPQSCTKPSIYASTNGAIIGSDNGFSKARRKPLYEPVLAYYRFYSWEQVSSEFE